jgi:glycosyltransferase involved in cell wall biosynthesis
MSSWFDAAAARSLGFDISLDNNRAKRPNRRMTNNAKVSILMLTYNAPEYVEISIRSVAEKTAGVNYELIVVDNASEPETRQLVGDLHEKGWISKLRLMDYNSLFAEGNNIAAALAAEDATHFLLLNSDIEVKDPRWLEQLLKVHKRGITTYGVAEDPPRVDGYCLLIDADLYRKHPLDEGHQWWWSVTKQQAAILNDGYSVQGYRQHEQYLHHFGGKSGSAFKSARGMNVTREEVRQWFNGKKPTVLDDGPLAPARRALAVLRRLRKKVRRALAATT